MSGTAMQPPVERAKTGGYAPCRTGLRLAIFQESTLWDRFLFPVFALGRTDIFHRGEQVAEFVAFGGEVAFAVLLWRGDDGDLLHNAEIHPGQREGIGFFGVIGEQADFREFRDPLRFAGPPCSRDGRP